MLLRRAGLAEHDIELRRIDEESSETAATAEPEKKNKAQQLSLRLCNTNGTSDFD